MARDDPQFNLRMSQDLKDMIANRAKLNGRSMNTEIIHTLTDSFSTEIREYAEEESGRLVVMYRKLRNKLPSNQEELAEWNERLLDVSFYFMKKISDYSSNYELLKTLKEEAEACASGKPPQDIDG